MALHISNQLTRSTRTFFKFPNRFFNIYYLKNKVKGTIFFFFLHIEKECYNREYEKGKPKKKGRIIFLYELLDFLLLRKKL